jgi:phenylalanyl-tRNA synthetase alpha chain
MNVIAWGLGLERPTMIQYNISSIKELFGTGVSIEKLKENGICLLAK